jgi:hypothetical protein
VRWLWARLRSQRRRSCFSQMPYQRGTGDPGITTATATTDMDVDTIVGRPMKMIDTATMKRRPRNTIMARRPKLRITGRRRDIMRKAGMHSSPNIRSSNMRRRKHNMRSRNTARPNTRRRRVIPRHKRTTRRLTASSCRKFCVA